MSSSSSSVQVVVRLRPMNEKEKKHGTLPVIKAKTQEKSVTVIKGQGSKKARSNYNFDNVFTAFSSQEEVFDATLKPVIRDVMQGYESTVFAYGQTGTGKTYTMEGNLSSPEHYGIIPRSAQAIFETLKKPEFLSFNVVCTYLEIYNEELGDLLADDPMIPNHSASSSCASSTLSSTPMKERHGRSSYTTSSQTPLKDRTNHSSHHNHQNNKKLEIMNGKNGTFCRGLTERQVNSASDVFELMQRSQQLRKIGETKMNKESSRSHCVFSIIISANKKLNDGSVFEFSGKLHMVDLAGSECAKTAGLDKPSGSDVARERERKNINQSLLTLGRVIKTLKEQSTSTKKNNIRIPYRDSKLTRILQESLGGRCKTLIIATLSPSVTAIEESMSTLSYAQEANGIVNKPVSSSFLSLSSSATCMVEPSSGSSEPNSVEQWQEMECRLEYMQAQVEEAKAALARKHMQQQELIERAEKAECTASKLENEVFTMKGEVNQLKESIVKEQEEKQILRVSLKQTEVALQKTNAILQATQHTEVCLTSEARAILQCLEQSIKDGDELYNLLSHARNEEVKKRNATRDFQTTMESILDKIKVQMKSLLESQLDHREALSTTVTQSRGDEENFFSSHSTLLNERNERINSLSVEIQSMANGEGGIKEILTGLSHSSFSQIKQTIDLLNQAKVALNDSTGKTKGKVDNLCKSLTNKNSDYIEKSTKILISFESNVGAVKARMGDMTTTLSKGLKEIIDVTSLSRKEVQSTLTNIEDALKHNLISTEKITHDGSQNMNNCLNLFRAEKMHVREATNLLNNQKAFIGQHQSSHSKEIEQLRNMVSSQRVMLDQVCNDQQQLQEEFLSNAFARMQQLLQEEMKRLSDLSEKQKLAMDSSCQGILSQNGVIDSSAKTIIGNVNRTNKQLFHHLKHVEANEIQMEKAATNSINVLANVENLARDGSSIIEKHVAKSRVHIQKLCEQEGRLKSVNDQFTIDESMIKGLIDNEIVAQTTSDVCDLRTEGSNHICHAGKTIASIVEETIEQIKEPQAQINTSITTNLGNMSNEIDRNIEMMKPVIDEQNRKADCIREALIEHKEEFQSRNDTYKDQSTQKNQNIVASAERLGSSTISCTESCESAVGNAKSSLKVFSLKDIRSEECVDPLMERSRLIYSNHLSATPANDVIVKGLDLSENHDETKDSISLKSDISCSSNTEICSSQETSSSVESHSSCSERKQSPLTELSINKENINDNNVTKKDSDGLKPRRKGKKRSNSSRQGTGFRKRIHLTTKGR